MPIRKDGIYNVIYIVLVENVDASLNVGGAALLCCRVEDEQCHANSDLHDENPLSSLH